MEVAAGDDVREHHRGAGVVVRGGAGEDEHAAAHHAARAEEEVERPENLLHRLESVVDSRLGGGLETNRARAGAAAAARTLTEGPDDSMPLAESHPKQRPGVPQCRSDRRRRCPPVLLDAATKCVRRAAR